MKETTIEGFTKNVATLLDEAQQERILVTRDGRPFAFVVGVANKDQEDLRLESSSDFWRMIEERRRSPTVRLADVEADLFAEDTKPARQS
jgi:antitoxin (DNA-binding transcriptional repressor) of toxin-antitoxin stability system